MTVARWGMLGLVQAMVEQDPPKIEFPCSYPIKVMGRKAPDFIDVVLEVMRCHAPEVGPEHLSVRNSSAGTFISLTVTIIATGEAQLEAIFADLQATGRVMLVL